MITPDYQLKVVVDPETSMLQHKHLRFTDQKGIPLDGHVRLVHVMSATAGGEIRGYVLYNGTLRLRTPCYSGEWDYIDQLVASETNATIVPYKLTHGREWD